mmetsp:Transcript_46573/g.74876  ORF Transcript_46573/g.74876 Transcript_46573/m.74876 type:complete len:196 (-) Transcript_46573:312-899(-)
MASTYGFRSTLCVRPSYMDTFGSSGDVWIGVYFVMSKVAEMLDTIFKVLMMRKVIFLHWYHHLMTCWVAWYSIAHGFGPGIWYASINFSVHGLMYPYFFLSSVLPKSQFKKISLLVAPIITTLQIIQMGWFLFVAGTSYYLKHFDVAGGGCDITDHTIYTIMVVIFSYMVLFGMFFVKKYMRVEESHLISSKKNK